MAVTGGFPTFLSFLKRGRIKLYLVYVNEQLSYKDWYYEDLNVARSQLANRLLVFYFFCNSDNVILLLNFQILKSSTPTISMSTKILDF